MIELYTYSTINGHVAELVLRCLAVECQINTVDLMAGEQRKREFLQLNPSGRIPVLVDHAVKNSQDQPLVVSQTGAIVQYLGRQYGENWYPGSASQASQVDEWIWFQLTDISTNLFNNFYLKSLIKRPQPEAADELRERALGFYAQFDQALQNQAYLCGEEMTVADLVSFPVVHAVQKYGLLEQHTGLARWYQALAKQSEINNWLSELPVK